MVVVEVGSLDVGGVRVAFALVLEVCSIVLSAPLVVFSGMFPPPLGLSRLGVVGCGWGSLHLKLVMAEALVRQGSWLNGSVLMGLRVGFGGAPFCSFRFCSGGTM